MQVGLVSRIVCGLGLTLLPLGPNLKAENNKTEKGSVTSTREVGTQSKDASPDQADNTGMNEAHDGETGVSADQASQKSQDIELTRKIRRALTQDKSLSTYAHNVKIITKDGAVTLKGPVRSNDEKQAIERLATEQAGQARVINELEVKQR